MAAPTPVADLIPILDREVNPPGAALYPTASAGSKIGYLEDGFWDARLAGILTKYTIKDGADLDVPLAAGTNYFTDTAGKTDLPNDLQILVVLFSGFRLIRLKVLNLAVNFKAEGGPISYEQQASATTLRAVLASLEKRLQELKSQYSEDFNQTAFILMDGVAQDTHALLTQLPDLQIVI